MNIRHKHFLTKPYAQPLKMIVFETDLRAVLNPIQFQILSLIASGQNIVISVVLIRVGCFWCGADHLEWEAIGDWLLYSRWPIKISILNIRQTNIFSRRLMFHIHAATGNYSIWNRLKSFTYPYAFSDCKSHCISSGQNIVISVIRIFNLESKWVSLPGDSWEWPKYVTYQ